MPTAGPSVGTCRCQESLRPFWQIIHIAPAVMQLWQLLTKEVLAAEWHPAETPPHCSSCNLLSANCTHHVLQSGWTA